MNRPWPSSASRPNSPFSPNLHRDFANQIGISHSIRLSSGLARPSALPGPPSQPTRPRRSPRREPEPSTGLERSCCALHAASTQPLSTWAARPICTGRSLSGAAERAPEMWSGLARTPGVSRRAATLPAAVVKAGCQTCAILAAGLPQDIRRHRRHQVQVGRAAS